MWNNCQPYWWQHMEVEEQLVEPQWSSLGLIERQQQWVNWDLATLKGTR